MDVQKAKGGRGYIYLYLCRFPTLSSNVPQFLLVSIIVLCYVKDMNPKRTMAAINRRLEKYEDRVLLVCGSDDPMLEAQGERDSLMEFIEAKLNEAMLCTPSGRYMFE